MSDATIDQKLGRLEGTQAMILRELKAATESRKEQYALMEAIQKASYSMVTRMDLVEASLVKFEPTIEEFISMKHKVIGAGRLGKWLWIAGAFILTAAFKFRVEMFTWLGK